MKKFPFKARNKIKKVLILKDRKNIDLAVFCEVDVGTVSKWCTNKKHPSLHTMAAIAFFLDVDIRDLIEPTKIEGATAPKFDRNQLR